MGLQGFGGGGAAQAPAVFAETIDSAPFSNFTERPPAHLWSQKN